MFAVFGISKVKAREEAEKEVPSHEKGTLRPYTLSEITEMIEKKTEEVYSSGRVSRLSPVYPSREMAIEYFDRVSDAETAKNLCIKRRICNLNHDGTPALDPKTHKQINARWVKA